MGMKPSIVVPPKFAQRPERYKQENAQPIVQFADNESMGSRQLFRPRSGKVSTDAS